MRNITRMTLLILCLTGTAAAQETGHMMITSNIKDAVVYINGQRTEHVTPVFLSDLSVGEYVVELEDRYGERLKTTAAITALQTTQLRLKFEVGQLTIHSNVAADSLLINGRLTGQRIGPDQPVVIEKLPKGDIIVRMVENRAGISVSDKIFLQADEDSLWLTASLGNLTVASNEPRARILLNGKPVDAKVPATLSDLVAGTYEVALLKGKKKIVRTFQLKPDITNTVRVDFARGNRWKYITIGGGLIGGSALAYLLTKDTKDTPGIEGAPGFPSKR